MKKTIQRLITSLLIVSAAGVQAEECCWEDSSGIYAKIFSGVNFLQSTSISGNKAKYNTGYIVSGSLGYSLGNGLHLEGEYAYRRNDISKIDFFLQTSSRHGHVQTSSYMANLLWDLPLCSFGDIQSYIGAGIGYDFTQMHASNCQIVFNQKWRRFSWQLMAGVAYPIYCNTEIILEYKFHQTSCLFNNNAIGIGLIYTFD